MGATLGRLRGADRDFRQGRHRERQFRLRHLHPHDRHTLCARRHPGGPGQWQPVGSVSGRTYLFLVLSGLATGGSWICYFRALKLGEASRVAPVDKLSVVLVAVFGVAFLGERLSPPNWLGVALIAAGAVLVAYRG